MAFKSTWPADWFSNGLEAPAVLDSLADGAYITDVDRRIVFWNRAAERITGWTAGEVVGRNCRDNILVHIDKDGHPLCGQEHCPLHRSIVTAAASSHPLLVFAQAKSGKRVPVEVSVAPIRDRLGTVVGGVEVFRDLTVGMDDLLRAKAIQHASLPSELPEDDRVMLDACYQPREIVGGDFYQFERLDEDRYAVLVADVMGHGIASALYTMQIRSLWEDHRMALENPVVFMGLVNRRLHALVQEAGYFASAILIICDVETGRLRCIRAGHPAPLLFRANDGVDPLGRPGPALGLLADADYVETNGQMNEGDTLLLFTDGAIELEDSDGNALGADGLAALVRQTAAGPSSEGICLERLEGALLEFSNEIHLQDDLTLVKVYRPER